MYPGLFLDSSIFQLYMSVEPFSYLYQQLWNIINIQNIHFRPDLNALLAIYHQNWYGTDFPFT